MRLLLTALIAIQGLTAATAADDEDCPFEPASPLAATQARRASSLEEAIEIPAITLARRENYFQCFLDAIRKQNMVMLDDIKESIVQTAFNASVRLTDLRRLQLKERVNFFILELVNKAYKTVWLELDSKDMTSKEKTAFMAWAAQYSHHGF